MQKGMKTNNIILIGGGGHCKSCIEVIELDRKYNIFGIIDKEDRVNTHYNLLGNDSMIPVLAKTPQNHFLITAGQVKTASLRKRLFDLVQNNHGKFATIVSPYSLVSRSTFIHEGTIIFHNAIVNIDVKIGRNVIINNNSLVEHDCVIGDHCHISTGAVINGGCNIGNEVLVGSNSVIIQYINITSKVVIGAGSVVIKDITESGVYAGNPISKISDYIE